MGFLTGKRVLILGLLSDRSIAYGIASAMKREGAELAFTYQMEKHDERVKKLAQDLIQISCYLATFQVTSKSIIYFLC